MKKWLVSLGVLFCVIFVKVTVAYFYIKSLSLLIKCHILLNGLSCTEQL